MALVKFSALVSEMRNKLNGSVFSKNRSGNYLRNKVTPVNPQSTFQQVVRGLFGQLSGTWRGLTENQRDSWNAQAPQFPYTDIFGDTKIYSGFNLYMKLNQNLLQIGEPTIQLPPTPETAPFFIPADLTAVVAGGVVSFDLTTTAAPGTHSLQVFATPNISAGKNFVKNQFRLLTSVPLESGTVAVGSAWASRFGTLQAGQKIFVRVASVNVATGQVSPPYELSTIVTAS